MRYLKVLNSIKDDYVVKTLFSGLIWFWAALQNIFSTNIELIVLLAFAITIDWITGHIKAKKEGIKIVSFGWRQSVVKIVEYSAFLFILTGISNVFGHASIDNWVGSVLSVMSHIDYFGFFYLTMTELKSITENLSGKKGQLDELLKIIKDKIGFDEIE